MKSSCISAASSPARVRTAIAAREYDGAETDEPDAAGSRRSSARTAVSTSPGCAPTAWSSGWMIPSGWREQRVEEVDRLHLRVSGGGGGLDGGVDGLLATGGELRCVHVAPSMSLRGTVLLAGRPQTNRGEGGGGRQGRPRRHTVTD